VLGGIWLVSLNGCSLGLKGLQTPGEQGDSLTTDPDAGSTADAGSGGEDASQPAHPGTDAGPAHHPTPDAAAPDAGRPPPPPPDACTNANPPCVVVPSGWSLVALASAQTAACPGGFDVAPSQDLFEGPSAAGGCSCSDCTVTQPPTCAAGAINVLYDTDFSGTCGTVAKPSPLSNSPAGACLTDIYQGSYALYDVNYAAPPPSGGACSAPGIANAASVTYSSKDRVCQLNDPQAASCVSGICKPDVSGSYAACIASPGHVACPSATLSVAHYLGSDASFTCADCPCSFTGTCSGTLTLYTNTMCTTGAYAISTDVCVGISSRSTFNAYKYAGGKAMVSGCKAGAPAAPENIALAGEQTVCCAQ
jgi:hypothetical protein